MLCSRYSWWLVLKFIKMPLEDKFRRKIERKKDNILLNLDFDLPCRTSPRRCSRVLLVVGVEFLYFETGVYKYRRNIHKMRISTLSVILSCMTFFVARTFLVERHLEMMFARLSWWFDKNLYVTKLVDKYQGKIH